MYWNRKMRSICRSTDRQLLKGMRRSMWKMIKREHWLAARLFKAVGRPPDNLFSHRNCEDCGHFYEPEFCAECWTVAAAFACEEVSRAK